ncbi:MAG: hypothetical protein RBU37_12695 [Myxococcota bacterium]|jgi:tetratricopeptide (TPR) repeat protein|nr:hypothetical protein [Myxococcota bacterium]
MAPVAVFALLFTLAACSGTSAIESALRNGQVDTARRMVEQRLAKDPKNGTLHILNARVRLAEGRSVEALQSAEQAARLMPRSGTAIAVLAEAQRANQQYGAYCESAWNSSQMPVDELAKRSRGRRSELESAARGASLNANYESAMLCYELLANELGESFSTEYAVEYRQCAERLLYQLAAQGRLLDGIALAEELDLLFPEQLSAYQFERGDMLDLLGRDDEAQLAFEQFIAASSADRASRATKVSELLAARGEFQRALEAIRIAAELEPSPEHLFAHGRLALLAGLEEEARLAWNSLLAPARQPDLTVFLTVAQEAANQAFAELALETLERGRQSFPQSPELLLAQAELWRNKGEMGEIESAFRSFVAEPTQKAERCLLLALWLEERQESALATFFFTEGSREADADAEIFFGLARFHAERYAFPEMEQALREAIRRRDDEATRLAAAEFAFQARSNALAAELLEGAFANNPSQQGIAERLAEAYEALGRTEELVGVYRRWAEASGLGGEGLIIIGNALLERELSEQAEQAFLDARQSEQANARIEAEAMLAEIAYTKGDFETTLANFERFVEASSSRDQAIQRCYDYLVKERLNTELGLKFMLELSEAEPNESMPWLFMARIHIRRGESDAASQALDGYCLRHPSLVDCARFVVQSTPNWGDPSLGEQWLLAFTAEQIEQPELLEVLGDAFWMPPIAGLPRNAAIDARRRAVAREAYSGFLSTLSADDLRLVPFGERMGQLGLSELCVDALSKAPTLQASQQRSYGECLLAQGDEKGASVAFAAYLQGTTQAAKGRLELARLYYDRGLPAAAEPLLLDCMQDDREQLGLQAYRLLTDVLIVSSRSKELPAAFERALSLTRLPFESADVGAQAALRVGDYAQALQLYDAMLKMRPGALQVVLSVAELGLLSGRGQLGRSVIRDFLERSEAPVTALTALAGFYEERGDLVSALECLREALELSDLPNIEVLLTLGRLEASLGRFVEAKQAFDLALQTPDALFHKYTLAVSTFEAVSQDELAEAYALQAIDALPQRADSFILGQIRRAFARGERTLALERVAQYRRARFPLPPLVDLMLDQGSLVEAEGLILEELERLAFAPAVAHVLALSTRYLQARGHQRHIAFLKFFRRLMLDTAPIDKLLVRYASEQGELATVLSWSGELRGDMEARHLRLCALLESGEEDEAFVQLLAWSQAESEEPTPILRDALHTAAQCASADLAFEWVQSLLPKHPGLLLEVVKRSIAVSQPELGLSVLLELASVVEAGESAEMGAYIVEACAVLVELGWADEAADILIALEQSRGSWAQLQLAQVAACIQAGREQEARGRVERFLEQHPSDDDTLAMLRTLAANGGPIALEQLAAAALDRANPHATEALRWWMLLSRETGASLDELERAFLDTRPAQLRAWMELGMAWLDLGLFERAAFWLEKAATATPSNASYFELLAQARYLAGDLDGALEAVRWAADRRVDRLVSLEAQAARFAEGPDPSIAIAAYQALVELAPAQVSIRIAMIRQLFLSGDEESGEAELEALLAAHSWSLVAAPVLGLLLESNQMGVALPLAEQSVQLPSASELTLWRAGLVFLRTERANEAVQAFERAVQASLGPVQTALAVAELMRARGVLSQAERFLEIALQEDPNSPAPHLYYGLFRLEQADLEGAQMAFQKALEGGYELSRSLATITAALLDRGLDSEAAAYAQRLLELPIDSEQNAVAVLELYGERSKAALALALMAELSPALLDGLSEDWSLRFALGVALIRAERLDEAEILAQAMCRDDATQALAWDLRARVALARNQLEDAERYAQRGLAVSDASASGRVAATLARISFAGADLVGAEALFLAALRLAPNADAAWKLTVYRALAECARQQGNQALMLTYQTRAARSAELSLEPQGLR